MAAEILYCVRQFVLDEKLRPITTWTKVNEMENERITPFWAIGISRQKNFSYIDRKGDSDDSWDSSHEAIQGYGVFSAYLDSSSNGISKPAQEIFLRKCGAADHELLGLEGDDGPTI